MTDRAPFEPIGEQARWKTVYDILKAAPINGIVTYKTLGDALDLHPDNDRNAIQVAMRKAAWEHEQMDKRAVDNVPNVGYRVVETAERPMLAKRQQKRSSRALVRGHSKAANIDLNDADPAVRSALMTIARAFQMQMDFNHRFDVRQNRLEDAIRQISDTQEYDRKRTEEEVAALRERLARLESGDYPPTRETGRRERGVQAVPRGPRFRAGALDSVGTPRRADAR